MAVIGPEYEVAQQYGTELEIEPTSWAAIVLIAGLVLVAGAVVTAK